MYKVDREQKAMMALESLEFYDNKEIEDDMKDIAKNNEKQAEQLKKAIEDIKQDNLKNTENEAKYEDDDQNTEYPEPNHLQPVERDQNQIEPSSEPNTILQVVSNPTESLVTPVKHNIESVKEEELEESPYQNTQEMRFNAQAKLKSVLIPDAEADPIIGSNPDQNANEDEIAEEYQTNLHDNSQKEVEGEYDDGEGEQDDNSE